MLKTNVFFFTMDEETEFTGDFGLHESCGYATMEEFTRDFFLVDEALREVVTATSYAGFTTIFSVISATLKNPHRFLAYCAISGFLSFHDAVANRAKKERENE